MIIWKAEYEEAVGGTHWTVRLLQKKENGISHGENAILKTKILFLLFLYSQRHKGFFFPPCSWDCETSSNPHESFSALMIRISAGFLRSSRAQHTSKAVQGAHHKSTVRSSSMWQSLSLTNSKREIKREGLRGTDGACVIFANLRHYYITRRSVSHRKWMTSSAGLIHVWLQWAPLCLPLPIMHASFQLSHNLVLWFI